MKKGPDIYKYTREHVWLEFIEENKVRAGITDYAQEELGELAFVSLPEIGQAFRIGEAFADVESAKVVSDVICPLNGTVIVVNELLSESPGMINEDPYGSWIAIFSETTSFDDLLTAEEYENFCVTL